MQHVSNSLDASLCAISLLKLVWIFSILLRWRSLHTVHCRLASVICKPVIKIKDQRRMQAPQHQTEHPCVNTGDWTLVFTEGPAGKVQHVWGKCWKMCCRKIFCLHRSQEESRQMRKWLVYSIYLCHTHTQIYPNEEADCQGRYLSLLCILNFPHDDLKVTNFHQSLTCCCVHVCMFNFNENTYGWPYFSLENWPACNAI